MWTGDSKKKRKAPSEPPKSWKGRVLLQNKTVKKPETVTRKVVWFSAAEPKEIDGLQSVDLTGKVLCSDVIKARQCLDFELHFKMSAPIPATTKLMVFVGLHKSDTGEEIKDGVVNNFSYLQCSTLYGVAVFSKLYLETRSQFSHFLEFTLWAERTRLPGAPDQGVNCYDRETYYPVPGTNTYRTPYFIPNAPSKKASLPPKVDDPDAPPITFIRMIPNKGEADSITYLTFSSTSKDTQGEIYVIWNDEILHLPFYSKGNHENVIVIEKVPRSTVERVPVYLKEKPAQDSRQVGYSSNTLYFTYTSLSPSKAEPVVQSEQFLSTRSQSGSFSAGPSSPPLPSSPVQQNPVSPAPRRVERRRSFSLLPSGPSTVVRRRATSESSAIGPPGGAGLPSDRKMMWRSAGSGEDSGSYEDYTSSVEKKIRLNNLHISSPPIMNQARSDSESIDSSDCEIRIEQDNVHETKFQSFKQIHQLRNLVLYEDEHRSPFFTPHQENVQDRFNQEPQSFQQSPQYQQYQPPLLHHYQEPQLFGNAYGFQMNRPPQNHNPQMQPFRQPFPNHNQVFSWPAESQEDAETPMHSQFYPHQDPRGHLTPSGRLPLLSNKESRYKQQRRKVPSHDLFKNGMPLLQKIDEEPGSRPNSARSDHYMFHEDPNDRSEGPYEPVDPMPSQHQLDVDSFFL